MRTWNAQVSVAGITAAFVLFSCSGIKKDNNGDGDGDSNVGVGGNGVGPQAGGSSGTGATAGTGGATGTGATTGTGGGPYVPEGCENQSPTLNVERLDSTAIAGLGSPFDTDSEDDGGPGDWSTQYGKSPEMIPFSNGDSLDVFFQDQGSSESAYVVHVSPLGTSYAIDVVYRVDSLGRIMGMTKDDEGNYYVATGVDEDEQVDPVYPPNEIHRPDIVRIIKFNIHGCVLMESDVDIERGNADSGSEIIVNPMVAASSRLVWGGDRLLLVHGHNTEPDASINGERHQKALSTIIHADTGVATRTSTMWVSHSFDQRALYDGSGFVELHLGDAFPRYVALGKYNDGGGEGAYSTYFIKGAEGANNTHTRLGGIVQTTDPTYGYLALFATERTTTAGAGIQGTRDVALVRVASNFADQDTDASIVEEGGTATSQMVTSSGESRTNYVHWLTDLGDNNHAERPRIASIGANEFVVLFERWTAGGDTFDGTFALRVDQTGQVLAGPTEVVGDHHISRGDDIVAVGGRAVYVTGDGSSLFLNFVASDLSTERISLP